MTMRPAPDNPIAAVRKRSRILDRLIDGDGRVARWPKRRLQRLLILEYLAHHFEAGDRMSEVAVNELLNRYTPSMARRSCVAG